jgi:4-amino-4-deoxy-L-arabinose transferase-like glycosyltransferase
MNKKIKLFLIIAILFTSFFLRFWKLSLNPVSLSLDEIVIAYDSYSILKTGHDQHGEFMPLAFRSIGDFKPPVLIYLMLPSIAIFGLNEFSTRFTIALFGSLTCLLVYFLTKEFLFKSKISKKKKELISLFSFFSLAISPWHIQFSRATFEAILALFFLILAVLLFLLFLRKKSKFLWLSAICFSLSAYSYHAERIISPLMALGIILIFRKRLLKIKKKAIVFIITGIIFSLPLLVMMFNPQGKTRAANGFLGKDFEISKEISFAGERKGIEKIFDNKPLVLANFWAKRYLDYFDFGYLFLNGSKLTLKGNPDVGIFHLFESIFLFLGIYILFFSKSKVLEKREKRLLLFWLLIGPLAASLANNPQHPLRSLTWIPIPHILIGFGGAFLIQKILALKFFKKIISLILMFLVFVFSCFYYLDIYYSHFPIAYSEFWQYGMKESAQFALSKVNDYDEIIVDPRFGSEGPNTVGVPYAYYLFYGKVEPEVFQNSPRRRVKTEDSVDFGKFSFRSIYWPKDRESKNKLFIGSPWVLPLEDLNDNQIKHKVFFKNGFLGFIIVESESK